MKQFLRNTIYTFFTILLVNHAVFAQSISIDPPNPIFRISTPAATGNSKTGNVIVQFSIMNYSISKAQFQLFPFETKALDEMNVQHSPVSIMLGRKSFKKQEMVSVDLVPGDSISCQILFSKFRKGYRYVTSMTAKNRVLMSPLFDQESVLNIKDLPIYWQ